MAPALPEAVMALINLYFTIKRLDRLEDMVRRQYQLADRQIALAEELYALHRTLRARDQEFFSIVNDSPEYDQRYDCAVLRANVNTVREVVANRQTALRATSAYNHGRMRNITQLSANALVTLGMPKKVDAYRFEDAVSDLHVERRFSNLVDSIATRFFSPAGVYAGLGNYYAQMTESLAKSATSGIEDAAYGFGRVYESFKDPQRKKAQSISQNFERLDGSRNKRDLWEETPGFRRDLWDNSPRGVLANQSISPTINSTTQTRNISPISDDSGDEQYGGR